jgi:hypothetical protein
MRYRPLDVDGDSTLGVPFLVNSAACVGQAILTRLKLWKGEWFVDITDGTPWMQLILGKNTKASADAAIKQRILSTPGVTSISNYSSSYNGTTRSLSVSVTANTLYGPVTVTIPVIP